MSTQDDYRKTYPVTNFLAYFSFPLFFILIGFMIFFGSNQNQSSVLGLNTPELRDWKSCKRDVSEFSVSQSCGNSRFLYATYSCQDGRKMNIKMGKCLPLQTLYKRAERVCKNSLTCLHPTPQIKEITPKPTVFPTCVPRPACLDTEPRCLISVPKEGFCLTTPTPSPKTSIDRGFCTADVKKCPDGTYVPRVSPDCEFKACPVSNTEQ